MNLCPLHPPWENPPNLADPTLILDPKLILAQAPDEHWLATDPDSNAAARCSLWWKNTPPYPGHTLGLIGHYAAAPNSDTAAAALLDHAATRLRANGCSLAVGPMDGNTWHRYRFLTSRGPEPAFFLEPDQPDAWPAQWRRAGFEPLAGYFSALNTNLDYQDDAVRRAGERLAQSGFRHRPLHLARWNEELQLICDLTLKSFGSNFLYTPISETEFLQQYLPLENRIRPELVRIAEHHGEPAGYLFALPDWAEKTRQQPVTTVIVKTLAVVPERRCAGLGAWLLAETQTLARDLGFKRVIHALMHESNASVNLSARYATPFRKYELFSRSL